MLKITPPQILFLTKIMLLFLILTAGLKKVMIAQVSYQTTKYNDANFTKNIDPSKPVGVTHGSANVDLMGGASYTIPIKFHLEVITLFLN
jgi:hypothetical protein